MEPNIVNERFMSSFAVLPVFSAAVEEFQKYFSLKVTGSLVSLTLNTQQYYNIIYLCYHVILFR